MGYTPEAIRQMTGRQCNTAKSQKSKTAQSITAATAASQSKAIEKPQTAVKAVDSAEAIGIEKNNIIC